MFLSFRVSKSSKRATLNQITNYPPENISAALAHLDQNGPSQVDLNQHDSTVSAASFLAIDREVTDNRGLVMNRYFDIIGGLEDQVCRRAAEEMRTPTTWKTMSPTVKL